MIPHHRSWEEAADFQIGLRPIAPADWLEGGEADPAARKDLLFAAHRGLVWAEAEGSRPGQAEVLRMLRAYKRFDLYDDLVEGFLRRSGAPEGD